MFGGDDGAAGSELWISDGSAAGTVMIADIVPGAAASDPNSFTRVGERVYFLARTSTW